MSEITFEISQSPGTELNFSHIDEEGLLIGPDTKTSSSDTMASSTENVTAKFAPLTEQNHLIDLALTSNGQPLKYTLSHHDQTLTATTGDHNVIFTVALDNHCACTFTLHDHIDRDSLPNLINPTTWAIQTPTQYTVDMTQHITTTPNTPYQLTFYYEPQPMADNHVRQIHAYWDNQLLYIINTSQSEKKGYTFSVEGNGHVDTTSLKFVGIGSDTSIDHMVHHVSVVSAAQQQLPIEFNYLFSENNTESMGHFTVNVTTTPPIELSNQEPFNIVYEQAVYQTIIVNDENPHTNPITTINLDSLFDQMSIPAEHRVVEVVQHENTNIYEVKISDGRGDTLEPITVADVQLSFPGGNGGLSVFQHNISIDEGSHIIPPIDPFLT